MRLATVTGTLVPQPGRPAVGDLVFTLSDWVFADDQVIVPKPVRVTLDGAGHFTTRLFVNSRSAGDDLYHDVYHDLYVAGGSEWSGTFYRVTEILESVERFYRYVLIIPDVSTFDLSQR